MGTGGQTQAKIFSSAAEAHKEVEKLIKEKLRKGYLEKSTPGKIDKAAAKPAKVKKPGDTDLARIRAAFKKMNKGRVIALCNAGPTQSGGWEDVVGVAHERNIDQDEYTSIFWHNQSHNAFDRAGNLIGTLPLHWGGDRLLLASLLKELLDMFHIQVPRSEDMVFRLRAALKPGIEIDVTNTPHALKFLNAFNDSEYAAEQLTVIRRMLRDSPPKVVFHAVFILEYILKSLDADDVAALLRRLEELISFKLPKGYLNYWERLSCAIGYLLDAMARVKHPDYDVLIGQLAQHHKAHVREGVACHSVSAMSPPTQISILQGLLHDKEQDICITALYSLNNLYELIGRNGLDAYFDPMLEPVAQRQLLTCCAILLRNHSTYGASGRLEVQVRAYDLAPQLRKLSAQLPKLSAPGRYDDHLNWLLAYPDGITRVTHGDKTFDVSVSDPISGESTSVSTITSFGLSVISEKKDHSIEFCVEIGGKVSKEIAYQIGVAYGNLYDLVTSEKEIVTGKIYRSLSLPPFTRMNALMITSRSSKLWLYPEKEQGLLFMAIPLFEGEADELEKIAFDQRYNVLTEREILLRDYEREPAVNGVYPAGSGWSAADKHRQRLDP